MRNLLGRLIERSPQSLAGIAQFWDVPIEGSDPHRDAGHLYPVLTDLWSLALARERLSPPERHVLDTLATAHQAFDVDALAREVDLDSRTLLPLLRRLYRIGVIAVEREPDTGEQPMRFYVPSEIAHALARLGEERADPPDIGTPVAALLERLDDVELLELAEHLGMPVLPAVTQRQEALRYLQQRFRDRRWLAERLERLSPVAGRLWHWLSRRRDRPLAGEARTAVNASFGEFRAAVRELAQLGVLWRTYDTRGNLALLVPQDTLPGSLPPARPLPELSVSRATTSHPLAMPWALAWDLLTVLRALDTAQARWRPEHDRPPAAVLRRLEGRLWAAGMEIPPDGYLSLLGSLARQLGLVTPDGHVAPRERWRSWLRFSFPEQTRRLLGLWQRLPSWPEGEAQTDIPVQALHWPAVRTRLVHGLRELRTGEWYLLDTLVDRLDAQARASLRSLLTDRQPTGWTEDDAAAAVRAAAVTTLTTAFRWFGVLELGRDETGATVARVTPTGAWLLGLHAAPPVVPRGDQVLRVDEDGWLTLVQPSPALVWGLSAFAVLAALGPPTRYRVTRDSVTQALRAGLELDQIQRFLERQLAAPLPEALARRIEEWADSFRPLWLSTALVIEASDERSLEQAAEHLAQAGCVVERLAGHRLLAVLPDRSSTDPAVRHIRQALRRAGMHVEWKGRARP